MYANMGSAIIESKVTFTEVLLFELLKKQRDETIIDTSETEILLGRQ